MAIVRALTVSKTCPTQVFVDTSHLRAAFARADIPFKNRSRLTRDQLDAVYEAAETVSDYLYSKLGRLPSTKKGYELTFYLEESEQNVS